MFQRQLKSNPIQVPRDSLADKLPKFSLPLGEELTQWTVWLSEEGLWSRLNTLSQVAILQGPQRQAAEVAFKELMQSSDIERNEKGEIAVHGRTYFTWTDVL